MIKLTILATVLATPILAHSADGGVHMPHAAYLAVVAFGAVAYAIFNRR